MSKLARTRTLLGGRVQGLIEPLDEVSTAGSRAVAEHRADRANRMLFETLGGRGVVGGVVRVPVVIPNGTLIL